MHTVELLNRAIRCAEDLGIHVREEWLDGASGGECEIAGRRWLFLDLSQSPQERLATVASCLASYSLQADAEETPEFGPASSERPAA